MVHANYYDKVSSIYPLIIFLLYFSSIEILQILVDYKQNYISDLFNILDVTYLVLLAAYLYQYFVT